MPGPPHEIRLRVAARLQIGVEQPPRPLSACATLAFSPRRQRRSLRLKDALFLQTRTGELESLALEPKMLYWSFHLTISISYLSIMCSCNKTHFWIWIIWEKRIMKLVRWIFYTLGNVFKYMFVHQLKKNYRMIFVEIWKICNAKVSLHSVHKLCQSGPQ
jgi:hypothetical protein